MPAKCVTCAVIDRYNFSIFFNFYFPSHHRLNTHSEIWEKFVEFESTVGDLASVMNVEKRRTAALKNDVRV